MTQPLSQTFTEPSGTSHPQLF